MERLTSTHWFCFVLQFIFKTPWTFGKNLRTLLRSWGFPFRFLMSNVFRRHFRSCRKMFFHRKFSRKLLMFYFRPVFLAVSALVSGLLISTRSYVGGLLEIFVPCYFLFIWGSLKFSEELIFSREQCTCKSSTSLLFSLYYDREGFGRLLVFSLMGFWA